MEFKKLSEFGNGNSRIQMTESILRDAGFRDDEEFIIEEGSGSEGRWFTALSNRPIPIQYQRSTKFFTVDSVSVTVYGY